MPQHDPTSKVADRFSSFGTTIFAEISALANTHEAVNLGQGFPDFDGPRRIMDAAYSAMKSGENQYAPLPGIPTLREAIAHSHESRFDLRFDPGTGITVTSGCTEAIAATLAGLVNPGEEVVLFEPYYDSYRACVALAGATPRFVTLRPDADGRFVFDAIELADAFSDRTAAVLVNTPHNPTGAVLSTEELDEIARLCIEHDAIAIADEVYEYMVYEGEHTPIATRPGMSERTVTMSSLGKTFSLTGWKIGWACAPADLTAGIRAAHQYLTFAVARPLQHAAVEALRSTPEYFNDLRNDYRDRRDQMMGVLTDLGFPCAAPEGGYFIMADHTPFGEADDVAFVKRLIEEIGVAAIPPSVFYNEPANGKDFVRFAFCKKKETLDRAAERLAKLKL